MTTIRLVVFVAVFFMMSGCIEPYPTLNPDDHSPQYEVKSVIDGDTVILENGATIRYIGINAPEREQLFYNQATQYHRSLLSGKKVRLEYDYERKDQFGRTLAYVFDDQLFVNAEMIRAGWAFFYDDPENNKYDQELTLALQEAQKKKFGMWKASTYPISILKYEVNPPGEDMKNLNGEWIEFKNTGSEIIQMKGFLLKDQSSHRFVFPSFLLKPGQSMIIFSGSGKNDNHSIFWGLKEPVWNNESDTIFLYDPANQLICFESW